MPEAFGTFLRNIRQQKGLTRAQAAQAANISATRLYEFEVGLSSSTGRPTQPNRTQLERLAEVYGVPPELLLEPAGYKVQAGPDPEIERLKRLFGCLRPESRSALLAFMETLIQ